jgi:hypothetical protein
MTIPDTTSKRLNDRALKIVIVFIGHLHCFFASPRKADLLPDKELRIFSIALL